MTTPINLTQLRDDNAEIYHVHQDNEFCEFCALIDTAEAALALKESAYVSTRLRETLNHYTNGAAQ
jgi:hypothetical protein